MADKEERSDQSVVSKILSGKSSGYEAQKDDLIDIRVHNPLRRIIDILKDIKKHQRTTVSLRFTIPLIALPIVLLASFQLGRIQTTCVPSFTSAVGNLYIVHVRAPKRYPTMFGQIISFFKQDPVLTKESDLTDQYRTLLVLKNNEVLTITHSDSIDSNQFDNHAVIISGNLNSCLHSITLDDPKNITLLDSAH